MLKIRALRKITLVTIALFLIIFVINIFPQNDVNIKSNIKYETVDTISIYLLDKNNYIARTNIISSNSDDTIDLIKDIIASLTVNSNKSMYLPSGFKSLIPEGTILNNVKVENDVAILDFNDNFFNIDAKNERKMIESIVYSVTEINSINYVNIKVNNQSLDKMPNGNLKLNSLLSRDFGINIRNNLNEIKGANEVTTYFLSDDKSYYVPITFLLNNNQEKVEVIINELTSNTNISNNISTYIEASTELINYKINENNVMLEFNNSIFNNLGLIDEDVMYGIGLSIYDNYNISEVFYETPSNKQIVYDFKKS